MIKRVWAKIDSDDIKCICDEHHRKCEDKCKEYVVKFIEINRDEENFNDAVEQLEKESDNFHKNMKKFETQLSKSLKKFKI